MKKWTILVAMFALSLSSCSDDGSESKRAVAPDTKGLMRRREEIAQQSIFADFISAISTGNHRLAFNMLHPKLSGAWTQERFTQDWKDIKKQISDRWKPEPTGAMSGQSPQGRYEQAAYRLDSNWRSASSVELTSMEVDGQAKIVNISIRVPHPNRPPDAVQVLVKQFVDSMVAQEFESVSEMFSPSSKAQYSPDILRQLSPILGDSAEATSQDHYRICANTVWYDAVRLIPADDPATFLELLLSEDADGAKIVGLSFKGRMKR